MDTNKKPSNNKKQYKNQVLALMGTSVYWLRKNDNCSKSNRQAQLQDLCIRY